MADQLTPKFTNRPDLAAKDPSWTYVDTSEPTYWTPEDLTGDTGKTAIVDNVPVIVEGEYVNPVLTPVDEETGNIEPTSQMEATNIPLDRDRFTQSVYETLGGDPWQMNVNQIATQKASQQLRSLWEHVFQGQIPWGGRLNDEQMKFWNKEKADFYNDVYNATLQEIKDKKEAFTHAMAMFDAKKKDMEYQTPEEKQEAELETFEEKEKIKREYETPKTSTPIATDIDDYVARAKEQYILDNDGEEPPPGWLNKKALEFKRAQADEVGKNRLASRMADVNTAQKIKQNETMGKRLAEIATQAKLIEAKGEVTPVQKKTNAKKRMGGNLAKLTNHYINLDSLGAIINIDKSTSDNILAAMQSSDMGQFLGRITGTNEQSIREAIKKIKPLLIQDIRQATDMGARGLDSEKELEFYLNAATNEKTDIQSNMAAIVVLDEAYGTGEIARQLRNITNESLIKQISVEGLTILQGGGDSGIDKPANKKTDEELMKSLGL